MPWPPPEQPAWAKPKQNADVGNKQAIAVENQDAFVHDRQEFGIPPETKLINEMTLRMPAHQPPAERPRAKRGSVVKHSHRSAGCVAAVPLEGSLRTVELQRSAFADNQRLIVMHVHACVFVPAIT